MKKSLIKEFILLFKTNSVLKKRTKTSNKVTVSNRVYSQDVSVVLDEHELALTL